MSIRTFMKVAIAAIGFASLASARPGHAQLVTPAGLHPGDTFRFVFVTDGVRNGSSINILDYNAFVSGDAGGIMYEGNVVTWRAIVSTPGIDAITNVGTNAGISGVYLVDGSQVALSDGTAAGGLWSGSLLHSIDEDTHGTLPAYRLTHDPFVYTGTFPDGQGAPINLLGSSGGADTMVGNLSAKDTTWVSWGTEALRFPDLFYGISQVLKVPGQSSVPEPSPVMMGGTLAGVGLALAWPRKRRAKRQ